MLKFYKNKNNSCIYFNTFNIAVFVMRYDFDARKFIIEMPWRDEIYPHNYIHPHFLEKFKTYGVEIC